MKKLIKLSAALLGAAALTLSPLLTLPAQAATLTLSPTADSYTDSTAKTKNFGTSTSLLEKKESPQRAIHIKFNVTGVPNGDTITSATLALRSTNSAAGLLTVRTTGTGWTETGLTYNNRPAPSGTVTTTGNIVPNGVTNLDVKSAITGNGEVSFVMFTSNVTEQAFASRTHATIAWRPSLTIVTSPVTPPPDTTAPSVPGGVTATGAHTPPGVALSWTASTDNVGVTGYTVKRNGTAVGDVTGTTFNDITVQNGQQYSYTVEAFDAAGNRSAPSAPTTVTVPNPPDTAAPTVPSGLTAAVNVPADPPKVDLTWQASTDNVGVTGYTVKKDGVALPDLTATTLSDTAVQAGQSYSYTVEAFDAAGNRSAPTAPTVAAVPSPPPPTANIALGLWRNKPEDAGISWGPRLALDEQQFGDFEGHWRDYIAVGDTDPLKQRHLDALAAGNKIFLNWKVCANPGAAAAGTCDASTTTAAQDLQANCGDRCWITFWHEPEDDINAGDFTVAQHKAMFERTAGIFRQHAPSVKLVWTMMGYSGEQSKYPGLWPGAANVDIIGHDPYIRTTQTPTALASTIIDQAVWLRTNLPGAADKPVVAAEFGAGLSSSGLNPTHHAAAYDEIVRRLPEITGAAGHIELDLFNQTDNRISCGDLSCVDAQAYKRLKTATES